MIAAENDAWSTVASHEAALLGGPRTLTLRQVAEQANTDLDTAQRFWRSMGFADVDPDVVGFTEQDVAALRCVIGILGTGLIDETTSFELRRAMSYTMDRLVLWQLESLVSDAMRRGSIDDTSARLVVLDHIDTIIDPLIASMTYGWKRHLAALLSRTDAEVSKRGREEAAGPDFYPLTRSLGFVDIVAFTQRAQVMGSAALARMLHDFESTSRDVITSRGARVVKTIGDAVMYIADDLVTAADVVTSLVSEIQAGPEMLHVRASLVEGKVVSRSGDVFGPTVNLASRLVDVAPAGGICLDERTATALASSPAAGRYILTRQPQAVVKGLGQIDPWLLKKA